MPDFQPEDLFLIADALTEYVGSEIDSEKEKRAREMILEIADQEGLRIADIPHQVDSHWGDTQ